MLMYLKLWLENSFVHDGTDYGKTRECSTLSEVLEYARQLRHRALAPLDAMHAP